MTGDAPSRSFRHGWRDGSVPLPALVLLFLATIVGALGGASIGGAGLIVTIAVLVAVIVLLVRWSDAPR